MWLRIVPVQLLVALPHFITISVQYSRQAVVYEALAHDDAEPVVEIQFAGDTGQRHAQAVRVERRIVGNRSGSE